MNSNVKMVVLLLCLVSIVSLFLPQIKLSSKYMEKAESGVYIRLDKETNNEEISQSMGITILVLVVIAIVCICINANVLSLMSLTAGGTLVTYNSIVLIKLVDTYKNSAGLLTGIFDVQYGVGFYTLPVSLLISIILILFNLNTNKNYDSYSNNVSYSNLSSEVQNQTNNYNEQPTPVVQTNFNQSSPMAMPNSSVNTDIFNQPAVAANPVQTDVNVNNVQPSVPITSNVINCSYCGTLLNSGTEICSQCGRKVN